MPNLRHDSTRPYRIYVRVAACIADPVTAPHLRSRAWRGGRSGRLRRRSNAGVRHRRRRCAAPGLGALLDGVQRDPPAATAPHSSRSSSLRLSFGLTTTASPCCCPAMPFLWPMCVPYGHHCCAQHGAAQVIDEDTSYAQCRLTASTALRCGAARSIRHYRCYMRKMVQYTRECRTTALPLLDTEIAAVPSWVVRSWAED